MTPSTQGLQIGKVIRFSIIIEVAKAFFMMNLDKSEGTATDAGITITNQRRRSLLFPIGTTKIPSTIDPSRTVRPRYITRFLLPFLSAGDRAKCVLSSFGRLPQKNDAARFASHFYALVLRMSSVAWRDHFSALTLAGLRTIEIPLCSESLSGARDWLCAGRAIDNLSSYFRLVTASRAAVLLTVSSSNMERHSTLRAWVRRVCARFICAGDRAEVSDSFGAFYDGIDLTKFAQAHRGIIS